MKNILRIMMLATGLLVAQSCGSKKSSDATESVEKNEALTAAEEKAKFEKQRAERAERRRVQYEKLITNKPSYTDANGGIVYNKAETDPAYVGGNDAMMAYLKDNLVFPQAALDNQEEGLVFVDFVIAADGTVREAEVTDDTNEDTDQSFRTEAIRVVTSMPRWSPGRQQGKAVDVKYSLPILFQIQ